MRSSPIDKRIEAVIVASFKTDEPLYGTLKRFDEGIRPSLEELQFLEAEYFGTINYCNKLSKEGIFEALSKRIENRKANDE